MDIDWHVYLGKAATTPDNWTAGNEGDYTAADGWIRILCDSITIKLKNKESPIGAPAHTSIRVNLGDYEVTMVLNNVHIIGTDGATTTDHSSNYANDVTLFLQGHMDINDSDGDYPIYMFLYNPTKDTGNPYFQWYSDTGTRVNYCPVIVKGATLKISVQDFHFVGSINLKECWA